MDETGSVLDDLQPIDQIAMGNCARIGMYNLALHGPGILIANRDERGIIPDWGYISREMHREHFEHAFPTTQTDWYSVLQTFDTTSERLVFLQDTSTGVSQMIQLPFSPMEKPTAIMMQSLFDTAETPPPRVDALFSENAQEPYDPASYARRVAYESEDTVRPPQMPPSVPLRFRYPKEYQDVRNHIAMMHLQAIGAGLRNWAQEMYHQAGRGVCTVRLEAGCFLPLFVEHAQYLPLEVFRLVSEQQQTSESAEGDRRILEAIQTYRPEEQVVLIVHKGDSDPSRFITVL